MSRLTFMLDRVQSFRDSRAALPLILVLFLAAMRLQWNGEHSIAVADEIGYITGGVNLVRTGHFINPWGHQETWLPPTYPVLIGIGSLGGRLDPYVVGRLISVLAAVGSLVVLYRLARQADPTPRGHAVSLLAAALLAVNPTFQIHANRALSESVALCLTLLAFRAWLARPDSVGGAIEVGFFVSLATLTRPETVVVAPLWYAIDWVRQRTWTAFLPASVCGAVIAVMLLPYAVYLHQTTGHWTISNKGEVNLAGGRAAFHQTPREYIDEETLELGYYPVDTSFRTEVRRMAFNVGRLADAFRQTYFATVFAVGVVVLIASGAHILWRRGEHRLVLGLAASVAYLGVVLFYEVGGPKNLHAALPAFSLLTAVALVHVLDGRAWTWLPAWTLIALVACEGATRYPRWAQSATTLSNASLRQAGLELRRIGIAPGVMYESGASTAYYSGQRRRYLTPNSLDTILRYIAQREPTDTPVYLTVAGTTSLTLHPSTRALLDRSDPRLELVLAVRSQNPVVVYRVRRAS